MKILSTIVYLGTAAGLLQTYRASGSILGSGCLCTSDQSCWPSANTFSELQSKLSQPLIYPVPSTSPCYPPSNPSGNCTNVIVNWGNGNWRSSHPGSMVMANFETYMFPNGTLEACFLNTSITGMCEQGRVPVIGVDARSVVDIRAAVGFAVEHNLKLVVKNTGHDFVGRSTARGAFMLWTYNMKNITYNSTFVPQGAPGDEIFEALTVDAGVQWFDAYLVALEQGRMLVGGTSSGVSVGAAGGWLAGGGHSFLSPSYGLGVDNTLEISIVLSTGEYLTASEYQNSDLFWALRGGGGGTYGIVTSVTYRTYPEVPIQVWTFQANTTNSTALQELVEENLRYQTQLTDDGWGGYGEIANQGFNFIYYGPNMTTETVTTTTQSWLTFTQSLTPYGVVYSSQTNSSSWSDVISQMLTESSAGVAGGYVLVTSRLLSRDSVANHTSQIAQILINCSASVNIIAGGKVSQIGADSAGLNPAWRNAVTETPYGVSWNEGASSTEVQGLIQTLRGWIQAMYDVTPNDGAYFNEASPFEVEWQKTFFGAHYSTLKSIKDKYDPHRMFVVKEGVGSDDWNTNLTCRY